MFETTMPNVEIKARIALKYVTRSFFFGGGVTESRITKTILNHMLNKFKGLRCNMSLKVHF